ncbi:hypothetical protein ACFLT7_07460 [candidate division KSB1 bacterium]
MAESRSVFFDLRASIETFKRDVFVYVHVRRDDPSEDEGQSVFHYAHDIDRNDWRLDPTELLEETSLHPDLLHFNLLVKVVERVRTDPELKKRMAQAADGDTLTMDMEGVSFHEHEFETY